MGCIASKPAADSPDSAEEKPEAKGSANQGQDAADTKEVNIGMGSQSSADQGFVDEGFVAWSEMEAAEEQDYLVDEEKDSQLDQALEKMYSDRHRKHERSYNDPAFWHNIMTSIEPEPDGFHLTAPFTLRKAHLLYRYLRSGNAQPLPRKFLYEVLIAACKQLEVQSKEQGALQQVPPPANKSERLFVCGDTHGQLQDVLWIFELHNEPAPGNAYLFNGDMADRGANAVEIFMLLLAYKLASPGTVYMNRGNHEQRDLNERPFANGGGFAWEVRRKYPHDENLIELFQRFFMLLPIASVVGSWAFVIHGGLFRDTDVTLDDLRKVNNKRQPPLKLESRDDELLFDALWSDPHEGDGVAMGSARGGYSIQFGPDVTKAFCKRTGVKSVIRSHQLPKRQRGFEITHNSMLLTIFSASNYGGVCRNRGGVLIFDDKGPAEVKEFYAPPLDEYRQMCDEKLMSSILERVRRWRVNAAMGPAHREARKNSRKRSVIVENLWTHLLFETDGAGRLAPRDREVLLEQTRAWEEKGKEHKKEEQRRTDREEAEAEEGLLATETSVETSGSVGSGTSQRGGGGTPSAAGRLVKRMSDAAIQKHSLVCAPLRSGRVSDEEAEPPAGTEPAGDRASVGAMEVGAIETFQVAYLVEPEMKAEAETGIFMSLRMQVCRMKAELTSAFVLEQTQQNQATADPRFGEGASPNAAEDAKPLRPRRSVSHSAGAGGGAGRGPPAEFGGGCLARSASARTGKGVSHAALYLLEYVRWLKVLSSVLPEYQAILPAYAPRLLATSTDAGAEAAVRGRPVNFMRWLDRFQVTIAYDNYVDFKRDILQRVLEQIKAKTSGMSMADVLSYFDPKNDGAMRITDVANVLRDLQLGLPERQLQQLVYELGFRDPSEEVEPVEVLTLLLNGLSNFKKRAKKLSVTDSPPLLAGAATREVSRRSSRSSEQTSTLEAVRHMLQANKGQVRKALGGESMVHLFSRADTNEDGHLSYAETKKVLVELVALCGGSCEVSDAHLDDLIKFIDYDGDGNVTFMEFVAAFGLALCPRLDDDNDAEDITSHLADEMMQQICSALYDRTHALQKAFIYLDEKGEGWLPLDDFENALLLVLSTDDQEKQANQVMMAPQVKDLVASLKRSHMVNPLTESPEIDYNMFIQSFRVIDTALELP